MTTSPSQGERPAFPAQVYILVRLEAQYDYENLADSS
jgi:hypothetical protein